jgi:hypothetical protein
MAAVKLTGEAGPHSFMPARRSPLCYTRPVAAIPDDHETYLKEMVAGAVAIIAAASLAAMCVAVT